MANIVSTTLQGAGSRVVTRTILTSSDTFTYNQNKGAILILDNVTAGALTVTIDGANGTTVPVAGIGDISVAAGFSTASIAAGACVAIPLDTIFQYLQGVIAVTGGTGIKATLIEY
ncbi:hypothetical protein UFOVP166_9 [uncultured Caudovirales phage]|uniref:Uncharacterized protein n=1 Tax=uncultured Caudovirales phage TaxID=2100421 RepID=A0A6J7W9C5_9CAUD|nr:hypothetical protein UFOVP166_9 [uncultured Caudovirales phage]